MTEHKPPSMWKLLHILYAIYKEHGEEVAGRFLGHVVHRYDSITLESIHALCMSLYLICEQKGWAKDALPYNHLGTSWSEIERFALDELRHYQ